MTIFKLHFIVDSADSSIFYGLYENLEKYWQYLKRVMKRFSIICSTAFLVAYILVTLQFRKESLKAVYRPFRHVNSLSYIYILEIVNTSGFAFTRNANFQVYHFPSLSRCKLVLSSLGTRKCLVSSLDYY